MHKIDSSNYFKYLWGKNGIQYYFLQILYPLIKKCHSHGLFLLWTRSDIVKEICLYVMKYKPAASKLAFPINFPKCILTPLDLFSFTT